MIQIIRNKIEEIIVVLGGYFRPYSSCFRSYNGELRTDVLGFLDVFKGFRGEIGKNIDNLGIFRSYYKDLSPCSSDQWSIQGFLYETGENVVLGKFWSYSMYLPRNIHGVRSKIPQNDIRWIRLSSQWF